MRDSNILRHRHNDTAAHIKARNQAHSGRRDIRANHLHRRAVSAAEFSGQLAEELGLVRIKTDYDAHHLMGHIPAHHLAFGPVGPHVAVHNLQQLGVADVGVAGRMHCANLFVAEFDTNRALAFCQNQVQDFFEAAAIVLSQQFIAVETNHATVADAPNSAVPYRLGSDRSREIQPGMFLCVDDRISADLQVLCILGSAERLIIACFEANITDALIEPLGLVCILFAELNKLIKLAEIKELLGTIEDEIGGFSCVGHITFSFFRRKKADPRKFRKVRLKAKL